ncbi:MAG TPA: DinB family protein [Gemmatimonadales bacterium]|nr:DinB family protein [Gemmatimonadales bacterium]
METLRLAEQVEGALSGPAWHGASLEENLEGLTPEQAAARPVPEAHSIWELVLHITAWVGEVTRRLGGAEPALPAEGDWPVVGAVSPGAWSGALERMRSAHAALAEAVRRYPAEGWTRRVGGERDAPLGTGVSYADMVQGLVQHDAYHGGQIGLLRKALGAPPGA